MMLALYQRIVHVDYMKYLVNMFEMLFMMLCRICKKCECDAAGSKYSPYCLKWTQIRRTLFLFQLAQIWFSDRTN